MRRVSGHRWKRTHNRDSLTEGAQVRILPPLQQPDGQVVEWRRCIRCIDIFELDVAEVDCQFERADVLCRQPKTRRNRVVPISAALLAVLEAYRPMRRGPWYFAGNGKCAA